MKRRAACLLAFAFLAINCASMAQGIPPARDPAQTTDQSSRRRGVQVGPIGVEVNLGSLLALARKSSPTQVPSQLVFTVSDDAVIPAALVAGRASVVETIKLETLGETMVVVALGRGDTTQAASVRLSAIQGVIGVQPNFIFEGLQQSAATSLPKRFSLHRMASAVASGKVVVIDTGVDLGHSALRGTSIEEVRLAPGAAAGVHGTAVVALLVGNSGPAQGVAQGAQIVSFAAFEENRAGVSRAETRYLARAFDQGILRRPNVMNLSFGGPNDPLLSRLLDVANTRGICVVAAGGNGGPRSVTPFPASHTSSFAITAIDESLRIYGQATPGAKLDVAALGVDVMSAVPGGYRKLSGTSFSTAIVSGGLLRVAGCQSGQPSVAHAAIRASAQDLGARGLDAVFGSGLFRVP
jgi:Subtilase family